MYSNTIKEQYNDQLSYIAANTTDGDIRTKARNYIVKISTGQVVDFSEIDDLIVAEYEIAQANELAFNTTSN